MRRHGAVAREPASSEGHNRAQFMRWPAPQHPSVGTVPTVDGVSGAYLSRRIVQITALQRTWHVGRHTAGSVTDGDTHSLVLSREHVTKRWPNVLSSAIPVTRSPWPTNDRST